MQGRSFLGSRTEEIWPTCLLCFQVILAWHSAQESRGCSLQEGVRRSCLQTLAECPPGHVRMLYDYLWFALCALLTQKASTPVSTEAPRKMVRLEVGDTPSRWICVNPRKCWALGEGRGWEARGGSRELRTLLLVCCLRVSVAVKRHHGHHNS